jgi:hypothetical protein
MARVCDAPMLQQWPPFAAPTCSVRPLAVEGKAVARRMANKGRARHTVGLPAQPMMAQGRKAVLP